MFTLQILDRGQTFYQPLEGRPLLLGSGETADLRLQEHGVAVAHARIEPGADGRPPQLCAVGDAELRVNGAAVQRAELALGDRIELGCAVLVVGRSVSRPLRPEDVLAAAPAGGRVRVPRRRRNLGRGLAFAAAAAAIAAIAWLASGGEERLDTLTLERLRRQGDFAAARATIERLRRDWAGDVGERQQQLDGEAALVAAVEEAVATLRAEILASDDGNAEWNLRLQERERSGYEPAVRESARIVRGSLTDLLQQRKGGGPWRPAPVAPTPPVAAGAAKPDPGAAAAPAAGAAEEATAVDCDAVLRDAERLAGQGLYLQAIDALQAALAGAAAADGPALQQALAGLRRRAAAGLQDLLQQAGALAAQQQLAAAIELLGSNSHRFPASVEGYFELDRQLDQLRRRQQAAERQAARQSLAAAAPTPAAVEARNRISLEQLRAQLDQVRSAEAAGDFVAAEQLLRQGADAVAMRDPGYAERLRQRADEFTLLAELHAATAAALPAARPVEVTLRSGLHGKLERVDGSHLCIATGDGGIETSWPELDGASLQRLLSEVRLPPRAWLGAAVLEFQSGDGPQAEALLQKALRADARLKQEVDQVLARGRGEPADGRGYVLEKDGFVAVRTLEARKAAQKLGQRLDALLRSKDHKGRDAFVQDLLAQGPEAMESVVLLFRQELDKQLRQLAASSLKKQLDKVAAQRELLDQARKAARDLIYDEVRYFYPFKPPAVSGDKAAEYARVQAEVDRLVDALRDVWEDDRIKIKVPASLQQDLDRLDWVAKVLADLGQLDQATLAEAEWARALPPGDRIDVRNYCRTPSEREQWVEWQRIEEFNARLLPQVPSATREQLQITNDYRRMFRHRPLALNLKLVEAASSHAQEMSKLGYFSHFSPTPGRRTPFDRIKLAGYDQGVSENIALHDGALSAHNAWLHSSGHHRNLLNPHHTEMGVAGVGRYWVQTFGHGAEYAADPLYQPR